MTGYVQMRLYQQADGSYHSDPAPRTGTAEVLIPTKTGRLAACGYRLVTEGDVIIWDGNTFVPGMDVFEEGKDPLDELL